jgi:hypothetical protein
MKTKKILNRRNFIKMTVGGSAALLTQGCQNPVIDQRISNLKTNPTPPKVRTRYDVAATDEAAKRNVEYFKKAVARMKEISKKDPENKMGWFAQAHIHYEHCGNGINNVHKSAVFLPWHRAYLVYFEEICRQILSDLKVPHCDDFALPYWDWFSRPYIPEIFWDEANNKWDDDLNNIEPPQNWELKDEARIKWKRREDWKTKCEDVGQKEANDIMKSDFHSLIGIYPSGVYHRGELESRVHNTIHDFVQGNMHNALTAALDPLFWLHHANVDRVWDQWMKTHEKETPPPKCPTANNDCCNNCAAISKEKDKQLCLEQAAQICKWLGTEIAGFPSANGNTDSKRICELLNISNLGYKYDDSKEIHFGDCINLKTINEDEYSIRTYFDNENIVNVDNSLTINIADLLFQPKNRQNLKNMQASLSQILTAKIASDSPSNLPSLLLTIEVEKPENPAISVRIFINPPTEPPINPSELSTDSPSYAATFSFFESIGVTHHHDDGGMNQDDENRRFIFDITSTILKLESFDLASARVSICPKFLNDKSDISMGKIKLLNLRLLIAQ